MGDEKRSKPISKDQDLPSLLILLLAVGFAVPILFGTFYLKGLLEGTNPPGRLFATISGIFLTVGIASAWAIRLRVRRSQASRDKPKEALQVAPNHDTPLPDPSGASAPSPQPLRKLQEAYQSLPPLGLDDLPINGEDYMGYWLVHRPDWDIESVATVEEIPGLIARDARQGVWLNILSGLNSDAPLTHDIWAQMIADPVCSETVAVTILHLCGADYYFSEGNHSDGSQDLNLAREIATRAAKGTFADLGLADPKFVDRQKLIDAMRASKERGDAPFAPPLALLEKEVGTGVLRMPYMMDETGLSRFMLDAETLRDAPRQQSAEDY